MADPGDEMAVGAAGRGRVRASHADREQVIEVLKAAFVQGRLDGDELDARVGQAFASRTYAELADLTADIPAGPPSTLAPRQPARAQNRAPGSHTGRDLVIGLGIGLIIAAVIVFGGLLQYVAFGVLAFPIAAAMPFVLMHSLLERRSRRQLPLRPGQGGQAPEVQQPGQVGHDPALPRERPDQARADVRTHRSRPGRPRSSRRGARPPRGIRPVPDAMQQATFAVQPRSTLRVLF